MKQVTICTDGSCYPNPGDGGWGFFLESDSGNTHEAFGGEKETTSSRMELRAVIEALEFVKPFARSLDVTVRTDSQYVVHGLDQWSASWIKNLWDGIRNKDLWVCLLALRKQFPSLHVEWCRGHSGELGNERADALALQGRLSVTGNAS